MFNSDCIFFFIEDENQSILHNHHRCWWPGDKRGHWIICHTINRLRPRQNSRHFPGDIFKWIFLNQNACISIQIPLKFAPRGPVKNIPALVQIMAWRRQGKEHIFVTWLRWVNLVYPSAPVGSIFLCMWMLNITLSLSLYEILKIIVSLFVAELWIPHIN